MNPLGWRTRAAASVFLLTPALMVSALAQPGEVRLGMSEEQVVQLLGEPTRKLVLVGKELRDVEQFSAEDLARLRFVYVYDPSGGPTSAAAWPADHVVLVAPGVGYNIAAMLPTFLRMRPGPGSRPGVARRRHPGAPDVDRAAAR